MTSNAGRVRTHYDNLKVMREAPIEVIRAAYKTLSQKYHPDRNPGDAEAARIMLLLNASYEVLSNPVKRRAHDDWIAASEKKPAQPASSADWGPSPTPPPTPPMPPRPVAAARSTASKVAWALGLGGIIFALVYYSESQQTAAPKQPYVSEPPTALDLFSDLDAKSVAATTEETGVCRFVSSTYREMKRDGTELPAREIKVFSYVVDGVRHYGSKCPAGMRQEVIAGGPASKTAADAAPKVISHKTGYAEGERRLRTNGHSKVIVDNSESTSDVLVKLVATDEPTAYPVRVFHVRKGEKFTANDVAPGTYEVRYRSGEDTSAWKSREFQLEEHRTDEGIEFSNYSLTLYQVPNGNMKPIALAYGEF